MFAGKIALRRRQLSRPSCHGSSSSVTTPSVANTESPSHDRRTSPGAGGAPVGAPSEWGRPLGPDKVRSRCGENVRSRVAARDQIGLALQAAVATSAARCVQPTTRASPGHEHRTRGEQIPPSGWSWIRGGDGCRVCNVMSCHVLHLHDTTRSTDVSITRRCCAVCANGVIADKRGAPISRRHLLPRGSVSQSHDSHMRADAGVNKALIGRRLDHAARIGGGAPELRRLEVQAARGSSIVTLRLLPTADRNRRPRAIRRTVGCRGRLRGS